MKSILTILPALVMTLGLSSAAQAKPSIKNIKSIVCEATAYYEEETPDVREPASGIFIFKPGSRPDVSPAPGAFLLTEYYVKSDGSGLFETGQQQFYMEADGANKISFAFILDYKASGELTVNADGTAKGFINQKTHVKELACVVKK